MTEKKGITELKDAVRSEIRAHRDALCRYFLAASAAGAGFATTRLHELSSLTSLLITVLAMVVYGASFFFGHRFLSIDEGLLWANHSYLEDREKNEQPKALLRPALDRATQPMAAESERCRNKQIACFFAASVLLGVAASWQPFSPYINALFSSEVIRE